MAARARPKPESFAESIRRAISPPHNADGIRHGEASWRWRTLARQGKRARLVNVFVATVESLGGRIEPAGLEELDARINAVAAQLHITTQTALRNCFDEDWGREAATAAMIAEVAQREATVRGSADEHFAVSVVGRLLAALGQATLYASVNGDQMLAVPQLDARQAAEAISGLGLAIYDRLPGDELAAVASRVVGWTRSTLEVFRDQLRVGAWSSCPCGELHGQVAGTPRRLSS